MRMFAARPEREPYLLWFVGLKHSVSAERRRRFSVCS